MTAQPVGDEPFRTGSQWRFQSTPGEKGRRSRGGTLLETLVAAITVRGPVFDGHLPMVAMMLIVTGVLGTMTHMMPGCTRRCFAGPLAGTSQRRERRRQHKRYQQMRNKGIHEAHERRLSRDPPLHNAYTVPLPTGSSD